MLLYVYLTSQVQCGKEDLPGNQNDLQGLKTSNDIIVSNLYERKNRLDIIWWLPQVNYTMFYNICGLEVGKTRNFGVNIMNSNLTKTNINTDHVY